MTSSQPPFSSPFSLGALIAMSLIPGQAAETPPPASLVKEQAWTLATQDTSLSLAVAGDRIMIVGLTNPALGWNWVPAPSVVPLPCLKTAAGEKTPAWIFAGAVEDKIGGNTLTLRFTLTEPKLELKSIWRAQNGPGPVENWVTVENLSGGPVTFGPAAPAAAIQLTSDDVVTVHRADKTSHGRGKVQVDTLSAKGKYHTGTGVIPLIMLGVGAKHGAYLGFEWELGGFDVYADADPRSFLAAARPITEPVIREAGDSFLVPSVYYGVYQGDIDDGSNRFKRWFWNHKITRSLHDNPDEPWTEVCMQVLGGNGSASVTGNTPQSAYDALAATGVELVKVDFWDGTGQSWYTNRDWQFKPAVWPNGFDFAKKAHKAGLKAALYMGCTYNDVDLRTRAGRDAELAAVKSRYEQGWFDMWRTDQYKWQEPMPQTYTGVENFLFIHDQMIATFPGYRYENCCNGGKYKGFAICRRMTFCTMNDIDQDPVQTRTTYYSNSFAINPVQLKSDLGPVKNAYYMRTNMLGSILTWAVDTPLYREHIALYKAKQRPILRGANVYHILPMANGTDWDGLQFHNPDLDKGSVFLFKPSDKAKDGDSKTIRLKGLDPTATYTLTFQDRKALNTARSGADLMDTGIVVSGMTGNEASEIIWVDGPKAGK